jgi:dipeptidyl aminopeptidase/acylaminoacyl peptidase
MDKLVPASQSEMLADALKKAGVEVTLKILPGAGHGGPAFQTAENRQLIQEFFDKHLKRPPPK